MARYHLKQWKSAGRRFPCCKFEDSKEVYKQRNRKIRHWATRTLHKLHSFVGTK